MPKFEFNTDAERNTAQENFSKSLLYNLYKIAEDLGFADKRIAANDTQKKNLILDMYHSNVISLPEFYDETAKDNPSFEDLADHIFRSYIYNVNQDVPNFDFCIKNDRRTEVIRVESPLFWDEQKGKNCFAFAYMPVKGFVADQKEEAATGFPQYSRKPEIATTSFVKDKEYSTEAIDKETFAYVRRSLNNVFNELGDLGITKDSKEFQELYSAVQNFKGKMNEMVDSDEYSIISLNNHMTKKDRSGKNLMDYFDAYTKAKGRESGDLSSKQVTRLNACGRMQALFEKIQDIAWQEKNYNPEENIIQKQREKIDKLQDRKFTLKTKWNQAQTALQKANGTPEQEQKEEEAAAAAKNYNDILAVIKENEDVIVESQKKLNEIEKKNPEHKRYNGFLDSDRFKDAIAGKLLVARLQEMDSAVVKKALTDKAIYNDLFAKIKESPEFRNGTALLTREQLQKMSKKSPSDTLKYFTQKKSNLLTDDASFKSSLQDANTKTNLENKELYGITSLLLDRSARLLKDLKEANSTFHSSSHKKFEASLENLHKNLLRLGSGKVNLAKLSFEDLKDAMLETAFAAQTYQYLHQGKTIANGGLNENIINRMAVASEIGLIYDYISAPDNSAKTCKGLLTELCAFKVAKDSMNTWVSDPDFKTNMAAYIKTGRKAGKAEDANTFAADITDYKVFREKEVKAVKDNDSFKKVVIGEKGNAELKGLLEEKRMYSLKDIDLKEKAVETQALI